MYYPYLLYNDTTDWFAIDYTSVLQSWADDACWLTPAICESVLPDLNITSNPRTPANKGLVCVTFIGGLIMLISAGCWLELAGWRREGVGNV